MCCDWAQARAHRAQEWTARLLQVELRGAGVGLDTGVGLVAGLELAAGDQVRTGLVAAGGHWLRDREGQAIGTLGDGEGSRGVLATTLGNGGETAIAGGEQGAGDGSGLHGAGLDDTERVAIDAIC